MFKKLIALCLLCGPVFAGTWRVNGVETLQSLKLDQTRQQTIRNGHVAVEGRYAYSSIADPANFQLASAYSEYYDLFGAYDSGSAVDTSDGSFQDKGFTVYVYPYGTSPYGLLVSTYYATMSLSDFSSTPFRLQLSWQDYGAQNMVTEGYYVQIDDGVNTYWLDAGNVTSLQVSDFTGWNSGPLSVSAWAPLQIPAGNLYGENHWYLYAKKEAGGRVLYSGTPGYVYDEDCYYYYWSATLFWDAVEGATSYILYSQTSGYWIETTDLTVVDDGDYALWNYGTPVAEPASPLIEIGDMFVGSNSNAAARINGDGQFETDVGTGTSPLKVNSPTLNENLNADLLDGLHAAAFQPAGDYVTYTAATQLVAGVAFTNLSSASPRLAVSGKPNATLSFTETNEIRTTSGRIGLSLEADGAVSLSGWREAADSSSTSNSFSGTFATSYYWLYASTDIILLYSSAIKYSEDGGLTWTDCTGTPGSYLFPIVHDGTYYFMCNSFNGVYRSADLKTWTLMPGSPVCHLIAANPETGTLVTGVNYAGHYIQRSTDHGASWTAVTNIQISNVHPLIYAGESTFIDCNSGRNVSYDDGLTWTRYGLSDAGPSDFDMRTRTLYRTETTAQPRIWRTDRSSNFATWTPLDRIEDMTYSGSDIRVSPSGALLVGYKTNLYLSVDGGLSFRRTAEGAYAYDSPVSLGDYWLSANTSTKWIFRFSTETRYEDALIPASAGISVTNTWTDTASMIHTQAFVRGVLVRWTKNSP